MDVALSIAGTLATLISVAIGLLSFTTDARLHRRIAKLRSIVELMSNSPSPVIQRALRMCLADLQARELLRENLRASRTAAFIMTTATIFSSLILTIFTLGPILVGGLETDWVSTVSLTLTWATVGLLSIFLTTRHRVFTLRRVDYMDAYFRGETPPQNQLEDRAAHIRNHPHWKLALITSTLNTFAYILCGGALGVLSFALLAPEFAILYAAISMLFVGSALSTGAFGITSATESAYSKTWPTPTRQDFIADR